MYTNAQAALRNLMETYSKTTRFILTCNYVEKIIDPIQSRCQTFAIMPPNKTDVAKRLVSVLEEKQVQYDIKDIAAIINASYPDIRRAINTAQSCVIENNRSNELTFGSLGEAEHYMYKNYFRDGRVYQPTLNEYWYERNSYGGY